MPGPEEKLMKFLFVFAHIVAFVVFSACSHRKTDGSDTAVLASKTCLYTKGKVFEGSTEIGHSYCVVRTFESSTCGEGGELVLSCPPDPTLSCMTGNDKFFFALYGPNWGSCENFWSKYMDWPASN